MCVGIVYSVSVSAGIFHLSIHPSIHSLRPVLPSLISHQESIDQDLNLRYIPRQPQKKRLRRKLQRPNPHLLNPSLPHRAIVQDIAGESIVHLSPIVSKTLKICM